MPITEPRFAGLGGPGGGGLEVLYHTDTSGDGETGVNDRGDVLLLPGNPESFEDISFYVYGWSYFSTRPVLSYGRASRNRTWLMEARFLSDGDDVINIDLSTPNWSVSAGRVLPSGLPNGLAGATAHLIGARTIGSASNFYLANEVVYVPELNALAIVENYSNPNDRTDVVTYPTTSRIGIGYVLAFGG